MFLCMYFYHIMYIVLLFSPIAIIVSTNIHLFYDVYLMEPIDCQAVVVASASIYWYCLFDFFSF